MYMVRGSELESFLRCRLRWKFAYVDGLTPKQANSKLAFGTLMHKFLETWYNTGLNDEKATAAMIDLYNKENYFERMDQVEINDMQDMLEHVIENYISTYRQQDQELEVIATELTFAIPLDEEIGYTGTIDMVYRDKDGRIWFWDTKTTNSIEKYDKNSDMDRQISRYWWALRQLQQGKGSLIGGSIDGDYNETQIVGTYLYDHYLKDAEIGGFLYNIILKDYPVPPKVLKNGSLSKDKSQRTTYAMYVREMQERGLLQEVKEGWVAPDEYQDILRHLEDNPKEFFRRIRVTRTQSEIDASIEELYATAMDMCLTGETYRFYRNITKECPWCPFQPICQASMDGSNVDFLVESLYTKGE